ncbi:MAG TPA: MFS transporter [Chloroflexi bacterium]|nr:MFS transporter [Chloroflexota bacterium]
MLDQTKTSSLIPWARLGGYYASFIMLGMTGAVLGPTLPALAEHTGVTLNAIGLLFTARSLGFLLGAVQAGRLYDSQPGHRVLTLGLLISAGMTALTPIAPQLWLLWLISLAAGVAQSTIDVGGNTMLIWTFQDDVGPFMNGMHFCFGVGSLLAPLIVARAIIVTGDVTWGYWVLALAILPVAAWLARQPSPRRDATSDEENTLTHPQQRLILLIACFFFLYVGAEISFGGWIYTYALTLGVATVTTAAYLNSAFWAALTAGRLLSIPLANRLRPSLLLQIALAGSLLSGGIVVLGGARVLPLWVGTVGMGLSMATVFPTTLALAERRLHITGKMMSQFFVGASLGSMTLPSLIGQLFESLGARAGMITLVADLGLTALMLYALLAYSRTAAPVIAQDRV